MKLWLFLLTHLTFQLGAVDRKSIVPMFLVNLEKRHVLVLSVVGSGTTNSKCHQTRNESIHPLRHITTKCNALLGDIIGVLLDYVSSLFRQA